MDIRYLGTSKRYSEAVVANGLVFLSGMVPENPKADAKAQTENVLAQIDSWTAPERAPARACVEAKLASPDWKVEIKITALQIK